MTCNNRHFPYSFLDNLQPPINKIKKNCILWSRDLESLKKKENLIKMSFLKHLNEYLSSFPEGKLKMKAEKVKKKESFQSLRIAHF